MKKALALFICIVVVMLLCACEAEHNDYETGLTQKPQVPTHQTTIETENWFDQSSTKPLCDDSTPSEDLIKKDLKEALQKKNGYATLTGVETVKSLTNKSTYQITLAVTAETKYANWTYEVNLSYTKYDQGWIVDDFDWVKEAYTQVRIPDSSTMIGYITEYLPNHEVYLKYSSLGEYMFPIENATVEYKFDNEIDDYVLIVSWYTVQKGNFANMTCPYISYWEYDETIDNWTLIPNNDRGSLGYHIHEENRIITAIENLDFSGSWDGYMQIGTNIPINITISNYSPNEFDADIERKVYDLINKEFIETKCATGHFTLYKKKNNTWYYSDGKNNDVRISLGYNAATLCYYIDNESSRVWLNIEDKLPTLS